MEDNQIDKIIHSLQNIQSKHHFSGIPIIEGLSYLTVNQEGYLALIVRTNDKAFYQFSTNHLSLNLSKQCKVVTTNQKYVGSYHVLKCNTASPELIRLFVLLSFAMGKQIPINKNSEHMISFFNGLVELFKVSPVQNLSNERQGLWGELFVLKEIGNIAQFARFWHSEVNRKFDFSYDNYRIEVKTTTRSERIHSFSHSQVYRNDDVEIVIASVLLQEEDAGVSLKQLIDEIRNELIDDPQNLLKLEKAVIKAGMVNSNESGPRYDYKLAQTYLAWYDSECVPRFNLSEPKGVSNTKYNIDLSTARILSLDEQSRWFSKWGNKQCKSAGTTP